MIKIGIIGTGFGSTQAISFSQIEGAEVIGLCGAKVEKTKQIAKELQIPKVYKSHSELFADPEIDLVTIATPNHLHKQMFIDALKSNKHIILEKPAGLNSKEIKEMLDASKDYEKKIVVDHPLRFNPITLYIKDLIENHRLGKITNIQLSAYTNYVSADDKAFIWIDYPEKGGGQILNMGTHLVDLTRYILGIPKLKSGNLIKKTVIDSYPDENNVDKKVLIEHQFMANIDWENGTNSTLFNTTTSFGYKNFEIKILGSKGIFFYDDINGAKESFSNDEMNDVNIEDHLQNIQTGRSFVSKSFKFFAKEFIDYLNGKSKKPNFCTLEQALENMKILENLES